jgi:hypothetical protein
MKGEHIMKIIKLALIISMLFSSAAFADTVTVFETPAGIYDAVHAKFAIEQNTGKAYVKIFLMDENTYRDCWGNQAAMQGISSDNCRVVIKRVALTEIADKNKMNANAIFSGKKEQNALISDMFYKDVDDGVRINTVKYVRVRLEKP